MGRDAAAPPGGSGRWIGYVVAGGLALATAGLGISWILLSRWSELSTAALSEADRAFQEAVARAGGGVPYVEISASGEVSVHRELERTEPAPLAALHLLAWEPGGTRLLRVTFPFWFVRLKMSGRLDLGTLTTALSRDWRNLDLSVSVQDLERRGPGLLLDHRLADGSRLLLWTE